MSDKNKDKIKFEEIQSQIDKLKNIDGEFGAVKDQLDIKAQADKLKDAGSAMKDKIMPLLKGLVSVAVLSILAQILFPWWTIAIVGFWVGYWLADTPERSAAYGFLSMFLIWSSYATYQTVTNGGLMTDTISGMLGGTVSGTQLIFATGVLGGTVTSMATLSGALLHKIWEKKGA